MPYSRIDLDGDNSILEKWDPKELGYPFMIRYIPSTGQVAAARWNGTSGAGATSTTNINDGQFHHIAFVKDGGTLKLYIDGVQEGGDIADLTTGATQNNAPLRVGSRFGDGDYFAGQVGDLRIWNVARTQSEIRANLNKMLTGAEPNLVGYYPFDATADDRSAAGNNGAKAGNPTFTSHPLDNVTLPKDTPLKFCGWDYPQGHTGHPHFQQKLPVLRFLCRLRGGLRCLLPPIRSRTFRLKR